MNKPYCDKCELHKTSCAGLEGKFKLNCIDSIGPKDAKIMFVGMNPGATECETKLPFTGKAGKKLDECLEKAGLKRDEVFITNLVRCKTPKVEKTKGVWQDREPLKREIKECKPYLDKEIAEVKPNVIILLGNVVSKAVIDKTGIMSIHGTPYWNEEYQATCIPLRPTSKLQDEMDFIEDLKFAKESSLTNEFQDKVKLKTNYILMDTVDKVKGLIKRLNDLPEYVIDIETTGLNPDTSDLLGISFSWKEGTGCYIPINNWFKFFIEEELEIVNTKTMRMEEIIDTYVEEGKKQKKKIRIGTMQYELEAFWTEEQLEQFAPYLKGIIATNQIRKIGHNLAFDICYLNKKWDANIENATYCTQLADYLPDPERMGERSLEALAWKLTDMGGYDEGLKDEREFGFMHTELDDLFKYACADSDCTYRIYLKQKATIKPFLELLEKILVPLSIVIREMEYNGIRVDIERINKLEQEYKAKINKSENRLFALQDVKTYVTIHEGAQYKTIKKKYLDSKILKKRYPDCDDYIKPKIKKFNFGSPKMLKELFEHLGIDTGKKTKTGQVSTDEKALEGLKGKYKVIDHILTLRHLKKIHSTYLKPIPEQVEHDGRLHTHYRLDRTATGRLCIAKGTKIEVVRNVSRHPKGINIEDVKSGDLVYSYNEKPELVLKRVLWSGYTGIKNCIKLNWIGTGKHTTGSLILTPEHEVRLIDGSWKKAKDLKTQDRILGFCLYTAKDPISENNHQITSIENVGQMQVYDLEVADTHCFIANGLAVHNSSSKPNLQNIPKKKDGNDIRDTFIASEGNIMLEFDLSQIEYRILAHFVNDEKMIRDIINGLDIHRRIASEIYGIPEEEVTKEQRSMSKTATFGVPYGRSAVSLAAEFNMPVGEAEDFRNSLLIRYPKVQTWINAMIKMAKEKGYVKTFFGRIRYLPKINDNNFQLREAEERKVVATCIQGTASDILAIYTINICNKLKEMKSKTKMILTVHDALFFDIPKEEAKEVIKIIKIEMERIITWQGQTIRVPIETDTQVGTRWGSLVEYEERALV